MPSEEMIEKLEGQSLLVYLESYSQTFAQLFNAKKYGEAYNLTVESAIRERGSALDAQTIQSGLVMISKAMTDGDELKMYDLFNTDFYSGLVDSGAPMTAQAMRDALEGKTTGGSIGKYLVIGGVLLGLGLYISR